MNNWQEVKLQDCISKVIDNRGKNPSAYYSFAEYPVIDNFLIKNELHPNLKLVERYIDNQTYKNFLRGYTYPGMVIMTLVGNGIGNVSTIENDKCVIIQNTIGFAVNKHVLYDLFLYYLCLYKQEEIKKFDRGSGQPSIKKTDLLNMSITLPPLEVQKKIAGVLGALDDKIELNNKINQNLEAQAQTLFKSWFVDFEPFGGQMPNDWKIVKLGDICECLLGGTPNRNIPEFWNGNIPWINSGEVNAFRITKPSEYISELGLSKSATKLLPAKTTVIAITGATLGKVSLLEINSCANQSVVGVLPNSNIPYEFIYPFVKHNILELISNQTGGAQQHINKQNVEQIKLYIPPYGILHQYQTSVKPIYKVIANNCFENTRLAELRDTLLPKLMSGEINVDDVKILADNSLFTGEI